MGWLYSCGASKKDVIQDVIKKQSWVSSHTGYTNVVDTLKYVVRGNVVWTVKQCSQDTGDIVYTKNPFIVCYLLGKQKDYGWGYKDIEESMGPFYYSCPLSFLKDVPVTNQGWRDNVVKYREHRSVSKSSQSRCQKTLV